MDEKDLVNDFENGYGGFISFDDDTCLFQSYDGEVPMDIPPYDYD